ncbi:hypothetical protein [Cellulomonas sp. RIT-PI-Y]|uniref:hypothetical protein n=1 Tax=Cellulomonas sp. RIT-PI-Y TaxID=3035297 RepID=UPI0021D9DEA3|nr:hypothetical protein [Cellulomonas sp. RIT-PI-Y]
MSAAAVVVPLLPATERATVRHPRRAIEIAAGPRAAASGRQWVDRCLALEGVPAQQRPRIRLVATELIREAVTCTHTDERLLLELDLRAEGALVGVRDPSRMRQVSHRTELAARLGGEWGIEWPPTGGRRVWCRVGR